MIVSFFSVFAFISDKTKQYISIKNVSIRIWKKENEILNYFFPLLTNIIEVEKFSKLIFEYDVTENVQHSYTFYAGYAL